MTSSNGNIFGVTGPLCREFDGHRWIPRTKVSYAELWCFLYVRLKKRLSKQSWGWWFETPSRPLWRHYNVMWARLDSKVNHLMKIDAWTAKTSCRFKASNMIVCIVGVKLPRVLSRRAGRSLGLRPRDRPARRPRDRPARRDNTRGSLTPTIHAQSCLIPTITRCHDFSTATNFLLLKNNLKFESRATAVFVAMSPRYLGGKYRSPFHPVRENARASFLRETERVKSNCARPASSASRGDNEVKHAVCLKVEFQMYAVLSNENGEVYTTMISVLQQVSMFFNGIACLMKVWPLFKRVEFPRVSMKWRSARARISNVTSQM